MRTLAADHGFTGNREDYDHPDNSMLDLVIERRVGLPILLSVVYVEVARRAGMPVAGVGMPGHFVVAHFGREPAIVLDPFAGSAMQPTSAPSEVEPWNAHAIALRMLNNLVGAYTRRTDLEPAIRAARMRLGLPVAAEQRGPLTAELRALLARLN